MKSPCSRFPHSLEKRDGFTLIEIAIVMIIIGLLAGGGTFVMGMLTERKARNESIDYLQQTREALISYASTQGMLPSADTDADGVGDGGAAGGLPYMDLKVRPTDLYKRVLRYEVDSNLTTDLQTTCSALKAGLSGAPDVVDGDGSSNAFPVAVVLVSAGPTDADGDGDILDEITSGSHQGDNTDGNPNYIRFPPTDTFDDLVLYIGENELYSELCEYVTLAVNNGCGPGVDAYVFDITRGIQLPDSPVPDSDTEDWEILSGTKIEIRDGAGGGASILASEPPTPIIVAGQDKDIDTCPP